VLTAVLVLATPLAVQAQFNYAVTNQMVTITGYTGTTPDVVAIPSTINGLPVISIGDYAFYYSSITGVTIPNSVTSIGAHAFDLCDNLTSVPISDSVTNIGEGAFAGCFNLTNIVVDPLNSAFSSVDGVLFNQNQTTLVQYPMSRPGDSYMIPNSVISIGAHAFDGCGNLTSVTIPDGVTNIGYFAFAYSASLTNIVVDSLNSAFSSVDGVLFNHEQTTLVQYPGGRVGDYTIPNSVTSIADSAFAGCYSLTNVTIPNSVTSIGDYAFARCFSLTNVTIPDSVTSVGDFAFSGCSSLTNITLGSGVTSIGVSAFSGIDGIGHLHGCPLINVTIPNSVTNIGNYAFARCYSLTTVTISNSVTSIGAYAFVGCSSLTSVTIPNSVISIGDRAFDGTSLTNITFGSGVTGIGDYAFAECSSLTNITVDPLNSAFSSVEGVLFNHNQTTLVQYPGGKVGDYTIPNSVTSIGGSAFTSCSGLTSVTIPNSVTNIGAGTYIIGVGAFSECSSLTSVTIPNSVTSIGEAAFIYCYGLTNVILGSGVTSIGDYAFSSCSSLTRLHFQGNAPSVGGTNVFVGDNATIYYLPGTVGWSSTFGGRPTAFWTLPYPLILTSNPSFGVQTNQFGFTVSWATNLNVVVEAATDLAHPIWFPLQTNALTSGSFYFSDSQWENYPSRFYRVRSQ
jgi:hypothetical protein